MGKYNAILNPIMKAGYGLVLSVDGVTKNYVFTADATQTLGGTVYTGSALRDVYATAFLPVVYPPGQQQQQPISGTVYTYADASLGIMSSGKLVAGAITETFVSLAVLDASTISVNIINPMVPLAPIVAFPPYPLLPLMGSATIPGLPAFPGIPTF